ncbi:pentapeptide repeat-containing protein [Actinomadura kijaniata]|uniref:pentapeptide repeat-containing protein n=1 Tax=Actinomadura kijaniata TaxID=46161 RepID=UPI00082B4040|nr:pentapeptide repeat-containing protein [Actinomadura kijaniata]
MGPPYPFNTEIFVSADIRAPGLAEPAAHLRSEWPGHSRATAPADRPAAEAAIIGLYRLIGAEEPRLVWIDSPAAACPPDDDFCEPTAEAVAEAYGGPAPGAWLLPVLNGGVPDGESRRWRAEARRREVWERRLTLWRDLVGSCGGWWPFERVCVVSERPVEVHVESWHERGEADVRLHRRDGPAMRYRDGWCLYALHGQVVREDIVQGERTGTPPSDPRGDLPGLIENNDARAIVRLVGKDFRGADLRGVRFPPRTDLTRADLSGADLRHADLSGADLAGGGVYADFTGAKLVGADLRGADLGIVPDFSRADLTDANLAGLSLGGAPECGFSQFTGAKLLRTIFTGSDLLGADFTGADVSGADFAGARFWMGMERASTAEQVSLAASLFGGATWDGATTWPDDRLAEVFRQASHPAADGTFRVHDKPSRPDIAPHPPAGASAQPTSGGQGDVFFDFGR